MKENGYYYSGTSKLITTFTEIFETQCLEAYSLLLLLQAKPLTAQKTVHNMSNPAAAQQLVMHNTQRNA